MYQCDLENEIAEAILTTYCNVISNYVTKQGFRLSRKSSYFSEGQLVWKTKTKELTLNLFFDYPDVMFEWEYTIEKLVKYTERDGSTWTDTDYDWDSSSGYFEEFHIADLMRLVQQIAPKCKVGSK